MNVINMINNLLDNEDIIMIDWMEGERIHQVECVGENEIKLLDKFGQDIMVQDLDDFFRNEVKS